jgi:hypothetical protein
MEPHAFFTLLFKQFRYAMTPEDLEALLAWNLKR